MLSKLKASFSPSSKSDGREAEPHGHAHVCQRCHLPRCPASNPTTPQQSPKARRLKNQDSTTSHICSGDCSTPHHPLCGESRDTSDSDVFDSPSENVMVKSSLIQDGNWNGAAFVISDIDARHSAPPTIRPVFSPEPPAKGSSRPVSAYLTTARLINSPSKRFTLHSTLRHREAERGDNISSSESRAPLARTSTAPELGSESQTKSSLSTPSAMAEAMPSTSVRKASNPYFSGYSSYTTESPLTRLEVLDLGIDEKWRPPPFVARTYSPSILNYTHLGGLQLGSLHVTNGRASPAASDVSHQPKRPLTPKLSRNPSSDESMYDDSDGRVSAPRLSSADKLVPKRPELASLTPPGSKPRMSSPLRGQDRPELTQKVSSESSLERKEPLSGPRSKPSYVEDHVSSPESIANVYMAEPGAGPISGQHPIPKKSPLRYVKNKVDDDDRRFQEQDAEANPIPAENFQRLSPDTWSPRIDHAKKSSLDSANRLSPTPSSLRPESFMSHNADSGYCSNSSLQASHDEINLIPADLTPIRESQSTWSETKQDHGSSSKPLRPTSILKKNRTSAPLIPTFANLNRTITTIHAQPPASESSPPPHTPRKLKKSQRSSQPLPASHITVQGSQQLDGTYIPPVPSEIAANLSIRTEHIPELDHTFSSMQNTREASSPGSFSLIPPEIRFPSPIHSLRGSDNEGNNAVGEKSLPPRPPSHRNSFRKFSRSSKTHSQQTPSRDINPEEALAIIEDFGALSGSIGGSPYDVARSVSRSASLKNSGEDRRISPYGMMVTAPRRKSTAGMDAQTATELARCRSKSIIERDSMNMTKRRKSFNDRGGVPGRVVRPMGIASDAPPLPPLPFYVDADQRAFKKEEYQQPATEIPAPKKGKYPDRFSLDDYEYPAPHPLPHSPQPLDVGNSEQVEDPWAAQSAAWKARRKSVSEALSANLDRTYISSQGENVTSSHGYRPTFPRSRSDIPNEISPQPQEYQKTAAENVARNPAERPVLTYTRSIKQSFVDEGGDVERRPRERPVMTSSCSTQNYMEPSPWQTYPTPMSEKSRSTMVVESDLPERPRLSHTPSFGRYSGGLAYGYEHGAGFGGSAGIRTTTGQAAPSVKGVPLIQDFGVDLGDVPVIARLQRL